MIKNRKEIKDILISLAENMLEFSQRAKSFNRNWYWEYYESIKRDVENVELRRKIYQQIYHLERFGYFEKSGFSAKALSKLNKIYKLQAREDGKVNSKKWDKKWRIVIFDIPEKKRLRRDYFRASLRKLGFKMLQNSIWVCPFGNFDEIQEIIKECKIEKYVVFIISDQISNDLLYRSKFDLL